MANTDRSPLHPPAALALKIAPLGLVALAAAAMRLLPAFAPVPRLGAWLCASIALLGAAICLAGVLAFRRARTTVDPMRPTSATTLVIRGIYRHTRNPMYLGFLIVLTGWALYVATLSAVAVLPLFVAYLTVFQIKPEEAALRARFGAEFDAYAARVRRWL